MLLFMIKIYSFLVLFTFWIAMCYLRNASIILLSITNNLRQDKCEFKPKWSWRSELQHISVKDTLHNSCYIVMIQGLKKSDAIQLIKITLKCLLYTDNWYFSHLLVNVYEYVSKQTGCTEDNPRMNDPLATLDTRTTSA